jgi:hypothetical protein
VKVDTRCHHILPCQKAGHTLAGRKSQDNELGRRSELINPIRLATTCPGITRGSPPCKHRFRPTSSLNTALYVRPHVYAPVSSSRLRQNAKCYGILPATRFTPIATSPPPFPATQLSLYHAFHHLLFVGVSSAHPYRMQGLHTSHAYFG